MINKQQLTASRRRVSGSPLMTTLWLTLSAVIIISQQQRGVHCARLNISSNIASATVTLTPTSGTNSAESSESLKTSLNESLTRFLAANVVHQRHPQQQQQAQYHQQQQQVIVNNNSANHKQQQQITTTRLKKISCDELSLVLLAQRALNMSSSSGAISRLIECKQENLLDMNHMEITGSPPPPPAATVDSVAGERISSSTGANEPETVAGRRLDAPREEFQLQLTLDNGPPQAPAARAQVDNKSPLSREIHFGAKMAISILLAIILLVVIATFVDYQTTTGHSVASAASRKLKQTNHNRDHHNQSHLFKRRDSKKGNLRDYRSLSLSSNCSSNNHFCSTASVASSSAPILNNSIAPNGSQQQQQLHVKQGHLLPSSSSSSSSSSPQPQTTSSTTTTTTTTTTMKSNEHHYDLNLQTHFCANQQQQQHNDQDHEHEHDHEHTTGFKPLTINMPPSSHQSISGVNNSSTYLMSPPAYATDYTHVSGNSTKSPDHSSFRDSTSTLNGQHYYQMARQILLAFSLRQSAKQIFDINQTKSTRQAGDEDNDDEIQSKRNVPTAPESVNSLHGLRFLSMIWVIIIHSYNFALRWMFFSNTTTLDGIYKSAASQLIANGSFACDSFFFAGGFLLPYLAFSSTTKTTTSTKTTSKKSENQEAAPAMSKESTCSCQLFSAIIYAHHQNCEQQVRPLGTCELPLSSSSPQVAILVNGGPVVVNRSAHSSSFLLSSMNTNEDTIRRDGLITKRHQEKSNDSSSQDEFTIGQVLGNIFHRYVRMMPLMMAIIGLCSTLMRYLGDGPIWNDSTLMYDGWCRKNWWINGMFLHNFVNRENMCLSHSWYSAVDLQLFLLGQVILFVLSRSRRWGLALLGLAILSSQLITISLTLAHQLPAVPLVSSVNEQTMNLYYGEIYIKPYCRASPYLIGILLAYLMRTTKLGQLKLDKWQILVGWSLALSTFVAIILAMQPAMNGHTLTPLESALYSALSRPLWALATGWMIYACITNQAGPIGRVLEAKCFVPLSRLTYPAFLIHPIVMALFYGSRQSSFHFSHYLMLYLILGNIVITYASAFLLAALFELPLLSIERTLTRKRVN